MVDHDIATNKIDLIQRYLMRIKDKFVSKDLFLTDQDCQELILFNLHHAIQTTMDLGSHIIADEGFGVPKEGREIFQILKKHDIITSDLSDSLSAMVGFRNILVHEYVTLNLEQIPQMIERDLNDINEFCSQIFQYLKEIKTK
ncbi:MAG: DUF86 domain-containing protein [Pseudomonadota bacterium]